MHSIKVTDGLTETTRNDEQYYLPKKTNSIIGKIELIIFFYGFYYYLFFFGIL